mgnify:CR=1 FL=1
MKKIFNFLIQEIKIIRIYFVLKKKIVSFKNTKDKSIILFEFNNYPAAQIGGYYFISNILKKKNYEIKSFYNGHGVKTPFKKSYADLFKWRLKKFLALGFFKIYKIYGVKDFIIPTINYGEGHTTRKLFKKIKKSIKFKKDILKIKIHGILIGDLIYDTYLARYSRPTVDLKNKEFLSVMNECVGLTLYWVKYFQNNKVDYVIGTHGVYSYAIPFRIALKFNARSFLVNLHGIKEIKKDIIYEHSVKRVRKKILGKFNKSEKKKLILNAKKELNKIISGNEIIRRDNTLKISSFTNNKKSTNLIKPSNKIKVLISPHDFFDAAHGYGDHELFEDYYEWLKYTFKISLETDYEWYVKTHPDLKGKYGDRQRNTRKIINEMLFNYKNICLLPPNYSHKNIISEGIDFVVTCHGSVAYEYSLNNIPALIASKCNPYEEFKFTINSKNKKDYRNKILNFKKIKKSFKINKKNIYEWYVLRFYVGFTLNWVFNYKDYCDYIGGWYRQQDPKILNYWILKKNKILDKRIYACLNNYLRSKTSRMLSFHEN